MANYTFKGTDGKTYTYEGTALDVANKKRTVEASVAKIAGVMQQSTRRTRAAKGEKAPSAGSLVRAWAKEQGYEVGTRGRFSAEVLTAYAEAHAE